MPLDRTSSSAIHPVNDKSATRLRRIVRYTGPVSYATGGESLTPDHTGMGRLHAIHGTISNGSAIRVGWYDRAAGKLKWFVPNTGAEVGNATDLSGYSGTLELIGV